MISSSSISPGSLDLADDVPDHEPAAAEPAEAALQVEALEGLDRLRIVLAAAMGTVLVSYAMLVPLAGVMLFTGGAAPSPDEAFAAAIPLWLAAHQIPLVLEEQPLGVLPLLPTLVLALVVARGARWAVGRLGGGLRHDAGMVISALAGGHAAVAVLGSALLPRAAAVAVAPWSAMVGAGLVTAVAAAIGVLRRSEWPEEWRGHLRGWPAAAGAAALVGAVGLVLLGAAAVLVGLAFGMARVEAVFTDTGGGVGAAAGMTLLALAYLPNAVVAGASWVLGPGVGIGTGWWTPFGGTPGSLPRFPWFAALPTVPSPLWAVVVVVAPAMLGLLMGTVCRRVLGPSSRAGERLLAIAVAAVTLALVAGLAGALAGGGLGAGAYDPITVPPLLLLPAVLVWVGGPACLAAMVRREPEDVPEETVGGVVDDRDVGRAAPGPGTADARRGHSEPAPETPARRPSAGRPAPAAEEPLAPQRALPRRVRPEGDPSERSGGPERSAVRRARAARALRRSREKLRSDTPAAPEALATNGGAPRDTGEPGSRVQAAGPDVPAASRPGKGAPGKRTSPAEQAPAKGVAIQERTPPAGNAQAKSIPVERTPVEKTPVADAPAASARADGGQAGSVPADAEPAPRTVGELVALRARQAAMAAEAARSSGAEP